jgi:hypothetical protein
MGTVEVAGSAEMAQPLQDPIFKLDCVYFQIKVEEKIGSGKSSRWVTLHQNSSDAVPFRLKDDTGKILVLPGGADLRCEKDINVTTGGLPLSASKQDPVDQFLGTFSRANGTLRLQAVILREHEPLYVLGWAAPMEDPMTLREKIAHRAKKSLVEAARRLKGDPEKMKALDANQDGAVDTQEWDAALRNLEKTAGQGAEGPPEANPILIRKSPVGLFVISDKRETDLLSSLGRWAWLKIFGGPALSLTCAGYLFTKLLR